MHLFLYKDYSLTEKGGKLICMHPVIIFLKLTEKDANNKNSRVG